MAEDETFNDISCSTLTSCLQVLAVFTQCSCLINIILSTLTCVRRMLIYGGKWVVLAVPKST